MPCDKCKPNKVSKTKETYPVEVEFASFPRMGNTWRGDLNEVPIITFEKYEPVKTPIIRYYRHPNTWAPLGCIAFIDSINFGWSQCNPNDNFNKKLGREIAIDRAYKWFGREKPVPILRKIKDYDPMLVNTATLFDECLNEMFVRAHYHFTE